MAESIKNKIPTSTGSGLGLKPGDEHYRAYVGPPEDYDLISAMVFNLLTCAGLRQHQRVLDIGCGSLRIGRLLIPYLNPENYVGVEPNEWLVKDGILNEVGEDLVRIKRPVFSFSASLSEFKEPLEIDFAIAQSIFSHCSKELIREWLGQMAHHLKENGALFATFLIDDKDYAGEEGWVYPGCVRFTPETMKKIAQEAGFGFQIINWKHPRQAWAIFSKQHFDDSLVCRDEITWNQLIDELCTDKHLA